MLVTLMPGVAPRPVCQILQDLEDGLRSTQGGGNDPSQYFDWARKAILKLRGQVSPADIDQLVWTRGYWRLVGLDSMTTSARDLVRIEVQDRLAAFEEARTVLEQAIQRWQRYLPSHLVVADTTVYINADKIEELNVSTLIGAVGGDIRLIVPIIVVDELDSLKRSGGEVPRWRAAYSLAVIDRLFRGAPTGMPMLRKEDGEPRFETRIEILYDPPGHVRLPIADDEIVDRALAVQSIAEAQVTLVTFDTSQALRADMAGLRAVKVPHEVGPEPTPRAHRRRRSGPNVVNDSTTTTGSG